MDDKSLQRKILDMKAELTNLKTAHLYGIGAFQYFTAQSSYTASQAFQNLQAVVTFVDTTYFPPLIMSSVTHNGQYTTAGWTLNVNNDNTVSITFSSQQADDNIEVKVVSTLQISSITIGVA